MSHPRNNHNLIRLSRLQIERERLDRRVRLSRFILVGNSKDIKSSR